jgi:hypothetical protein
MAFSREHQQWINELVGSVQFQVAAAADANGNFGVFRVGSSPDDAPPDNVVNEAVRQLRAKGIHASNEGLGQIKIMPPWKKSEP